MSLTIASNFKNSPKPDLPLLLRFHHGQGTLGNEKSYWRTVGGKTTRFLVPFQMFNKQKCPSFWRYLSNEKSYWIMMMCVTPRYSVMRGSHSLGTRRAQRMKSRRSQGPPTRGWGAEGPQTSCVLILVTWQVCLRQHPHPDPGQEALSAGPQPSQAARPAPSH